MKPEDQMEKWVDEAVAALRPVVTAQSIVAYVERHHARDMDAMRQEIRQGIKNKNRRFYMLFTPAVAVAFAVNIAIGCFAFYAGPAPGNGMGIVASLVLAGVIFMLGYWLGRRVMQSGPQTTAVEYQGLAEGIGSGAAVPG